MSGFLANLARRAAGLPPVSQAQAAAIGRRDAALGPRSVATADAGVTEPNGADAEGAEGRALIDPVPVAPVPSSATPAPQPAVPAVIAPDSGSASAVAAVHATSVTPVVQRALMPSAAPPSASPAAPPIPSPIVTPALPAPPAAPQTSPRDETRGLLRFPFAVRPAPEEPPVVAQPAAAAMPSADVEPAPVRSPQLAHMIDRVFTETRVVEPVPSLSVTTPGTSAAAAVLPAPTAPAAAAARGADTPVERVVQVRIGAIEIHGAAPAVPAAPASPPAANASQLSAPGDFDRYTALRSYAPWEG